jgi:predicted MFS family arabinose efflux permease
VYPLILFGSILIALAALYILFSSKKFEEKVFRVDSDNITWVLAAIGIIFMSIYNIINIDWTADPQRLAGTLFIPFAFLVVAAYLLRKAKHIAQQKARKQKC